jgi:hypothetical protein
MVYAPDLKSDGSSLAGSSPAAPTNLSKSERPIPLNNRAATLGEVRKLILDQTTFSRSELSRRAGYDRNAIKTFVDNSYKGGYGPGFLLIKSVLMSLGYDLRIVRLVGEKNVRRSETHLIKRPRRKRQNNVSKDIKHGV